MYPENIMWIFKSHKKMNCSRMSCNIQTQLKIENAKSTLECGYV